MNHTKTYSAKKIHVWGFLTRKDFVCMAVLTLLFTFLAFFRLGNAYAPKTSYVTTPENRDIILDFGEYTGISSISLFLNSQSDRHFSLSAFNEVTRQWEVFNGDAVASSVFAWNKLDINYRLRYLGIVPLDENTVLNELVAKTTEGSVILPANAEEYPALFDEQEMFPAVSTYLDSTMFDEVYHGRTAYEFIHGLVTYETTHPHLGKILIALGILMFGMNPFGMRFMSAIFGILTVPLVYVLAKRLFKSTFCAASTTFLLVFDCMHFTLSRIATIDIFVAFFILLMYYFMYRYITEDAAYRLTGNHSADKFPPRRVYLPLALCGISMGLGIATKWTGVYAGAGLAVIFLIHTITYYPKKQTLRLFFFCCVFFIAIPLVFYVLCFIPVVGSTPYNGLIDKAIKGSQYMLHYHSTLESTHHYSSPFYEWPIIWTPLLDSCNNISATEVSAVSTMGNPAIWWVGIPCVLFVFYRALIRRDKQAGFLSIAYLAQYVPWMLVRRCVFIYHYFPAAIMTILCMGYTISRILCAVPKSVSGTEKAGTENAKPAAKRKAAIAVYLAIAAGCFFLFYPVISGFPISREWGLHLRLLKDWVLVL